jgi:hypothetical protein
VVVDHPALMSGRVLKSPENPAILLVNQWSTADGHVIGVDQSELQYVS